MIFASWSAGLGKAIRLLNGSSRDRFSVDETSAIPVITRTEDEAYSDMNNRSPASLVVIPFGLLNLANWPSPSNVPTAPEPARILISPDKLIRNILCTPIPVAYRYPDANVIKPIPQPAE